MFNVSRTSGSVYFFLNCCVYHVRLDWPCYTHDLPCCRLTRSMFHDNLALFQPQHGVLNNKDHTIYKEITLTLFVFIRLSQLSNSSLKTGFWSDRVALMNAIGPVALYPEPSESKPQLGMVLFDNKSVTDTFGRLTQSQTKNSCRKKCHITCHVRVIECVVDRVHQCVNLDGPCVTALVFERNFGVILMFVWRCVIDTIM